MKVLIVDDSVVYRSAISQALQSLNEIELLKTANNGKIALDLMQSNSYDLVTLDLEMPVMDGLSTLREIKKLEKPPKVIVYSSQTLNGASKTIEALNLGALDFATKVENSNNIEQSINQIREDLVPKIIALASDSGQVQKKSAVLKSLDFLKSYQPQLITIGSSTGGPDALKKVLTNLDETVNVPILIVQHMPKFFTKKLAEDLDKYSKLTIKEAENGEIIKPKTAYIAPGDYHMELFSQEGQSAIKLHQGEKICYVRPAVDVLFNSIAKNYKGNTLALILTGMGSDGANGCQELTERKFPIIIQDKATSVVWGMPGAVAERELQSGELPLSQIPECINKLFR